MLMFKKIFNLLKRFIFGVLFIYAFNEMSLPLNVIIPINVFTVILVLLCGIPSILMLVLFSLVCI